MTLLQLVAVEGEVVNGPLRFRANENQEDRMAEEDGIDRQLRQMETMALQHFPDDEIARKRYLLGLYNQRLGEMRMQIERLGLQALQVREMK